MIDLKFFLERISHTELHDRFLSVGTAQPHLIPTVAYICLNNWTHNKPNQTVAYLCVNNWTHNENQRKTPKCDGNRNLARQGKRQREQCSSNFVNQEVDKRICLHLVQRLVFVSFVFVFVFVIASIDVDCSVDLIGICA